MQPAQRALLLSLISLVSLTACDPSDSGSSAGLSSGLSTTPINGGGSGSTGPGGFSGQAGAPGGTKNTVVTTTSVPMVSVTAGASQTVSITFTSSDGRPITGLGISSTTLPADWSGTDDYSCTLVGAGSSCVLNLTYAPAAAESGSVAINYIFINNAGQPQTPGGTVTIPYVATTANNIVAASSPIGQITTALGASAQSVSINFTTDDGNAATNLALTTDLATLPTGWSSSATALTCAIVSYGNGCQLPLKFAPKAATGGTLALSYSYVDNTGAARTGTLNVPYSTTTNGTITATVAPAGQVNAVEKTGNQAVTVNFTTDDGKAASNLQVLTDLTKLPAGWTGPSGQFACGSVSTGNGCQLKLNYAPTALTSGTVSINYSYRDAGGTYNVGSFNVEYAATTNDNVVGTAAPAGQISTIVGSASPTVSVTFATDDGRPATALAVTTDLTTLPGGWSSSVSTFTCSGVNGGTTCVLPLTYTPTNADSGTLTLAYQYDNDAGQAKTGTVAIPYIATTNNNVNATASLNTLAVLTGSTTPLTVTFVTDDGNPASALSITAGLSPLPAGWTSGSTTFTCDSVSVGTGCQLSLSYLPTLADAGSLTLSYSYTNNSGTVKTAMVAIAYTATVPVPPGP